MKFKLLFFGVLTDVVGSSHIEFVTDLNNVELLNKDLQNIYPLLKDQVYQIALNQEIISVEKEIIDGDELAFLPSFSGG